MNSKGILIVAAIGAAFGLVACGGGTGGTASDNTAPAQPQAAAQPQIIKYAIDAPDVQALDANGVAHDNMKALTSTLVKAGVPVTIVVENYDSGQHGMFFPSINLSKLAEGSKIPGQPVETTFTFTPAKAGDLRWYCPIPCDTEQDGWAMSQSDTGPGQDGYMAGTIQVT